MTTNQFFEEQRWLSASNTGSVEIPAYGIVEIAGVVEVGGQARGLSVKRPTDSGKVWAVNSGVRIPTAGWGVVTVDSPMWVATAAEYSLGDTFGIDFDSCLGHEDRPSRFVTIASKTSPYRALAIMDLGLQRIHRGKAAATISEGNSGNVDLYKIGGGDAGTDTTQNATAGFYSCNEGQENIVSPNEILVLQEVSEFLIIGRECP